MKKRKKKEHVQHHTPALPTAMLDTPIADILMMATNSMNKAIHKGSKAELTTHIKDINNLAQLIKKLESYYPKKGVMMNLNYPTIGAFMRTIMLNTLINEVTDNKKIALYLDIEPAPKHIRNTILFTDNEHSTTPTALDSHLLFTLIIQRGYALNEKGLHTPQGNEILPMWLMKAISPTMDDTLRLFGISTTKKTRAKIPGIPQRQTARRPRGKSQGNAPEQPTRAKDAVKPTDGRRRRTAQKKAATTTSGQRKGRRRSRTRKAKKAS